MIRLAQLPVLLATSHALLWLASIELNEASQLQPFHVWEMVQAAGQPGLGPVLHRRTSVFALSCTAIFKLFKLISYSVTAY